MRVVGILLALICGCAERVLPRIDDGSDADAAVRPLFDLSLRDLTNPVDQSRFVRTLAFAPPMVFYGMQEPPFIGIGTAFASAHVADFDGDGKADVVAGDGWYSALHVFEGDGTGFLRPKQVVPGVAPFALKSADLDHDGHLDAIGVGDPSVTVWLNRGDGSFGGP